mgnify:CR=1 FL=1
MDYHADIPVELARAAHAGTSFVPEERAGQERAGYAETLAGDWERLSKLATTEEKRRALVEEFARYREGYGRRYRAYLSSRSRCLSTMIAGPSRFPVRRMEKRNAVADRRCSELIEFRVRALAAIRKALCPELAPIMAGDADAVERLQAKVAKAEQMQERMKATNAAIRKHAKAGPEAQVWALVALGFTEGTARKLLEPDFCKRIGFPSYELTNNGANIRRMKERLEAVSQAKATPATEQEGTAARVEDCPGENRVKLFFPGKPDEATRETLKRGGFRWAPSECAWKAYRHQHTLDLARKVAGVPATEAKA